jgi:hypothetical protein
MHRLRLPLPRPLHPVQPQRPSRYGKRRLPVAPQSASRAGRNLALVAEAPTAREDEATGNRGFRVGLNVAVGVGTFSKDGNNLTHLIGQPSTGLRPRASRHVGHPRPRTRKRTSSPRRTAAPRFRIRTRHPRPRQSNDQWCPHIWGPASRQPPPPAAPRRRHDPLLPARHSTTWASSGGSPCEPPPPPTMSRTQSSARSSALRTMASASFTAERNDSLRRLFDFCLGIDRFLNARLLDTTRRPAKSRSRVVLRRDPAALHHARREQARRRVRGTQRRD